MNSYHPRYALFFICIVIVVSGFALEEENKFTFDVLWAATEQYEDIKLSLYSVGYIPSFENLVHQEFMILKGQPFDACSKMDLDLKQILTEQILITVDGNREECSLNNKIEKVMELGVKGIIITTTSKNVNLVFPKNSAFLIFLAVDQEPIEALTNSEELFGIIAEREKSKLKKVEIWISSQSSQSYELLSIFNKTISQNPSIAQVINWKPRYAFWSCIGAKSSQECAQNSEYVSSCACGGLFCPPQKFISSADIVVKEDIRQKIIFQKYPQYFFNYTSIFAKKCLLMSPENKYYEDCSLMVMNYLEMEAQGIEKDVESFMKNCDGQIFKELILDRSRYPEIGYYPVFLIHREQIVFEDSKDLKMQLCRKLNTENLSDCSRTGSKILYVTIHYMVPIIIGSVLFILIIILIIKFKQKLRKDLKKQIAMQVQPTVANYFTLEQSK